VNEEAFFAGFLHAKVKELEYAQSFQC
jgi:hypothetical protein